MNRIKEGILYISLHNQLIKKFGVNHIITKKDIFEKLGRHQQIPKAVRELAMKELESKGLIKIDSIHCIRILPCEIDLETESHKLYELAGLLTTK